MDVLPRADATAALNMAQDLLLLEAYPRPGVPRLRAYGWAEPAYTFGVSQRWGEWRSRAPATCALVRRPTGGGLVSHLEDWTFALAVPSDHPLVALEALASYGAVLRALEQALRGLGQPVAAVAAPGGPRAYRAPEICAERPEPHDLVRSDDGRKVAGAAQKRGRDGLLLQGYVDRAVLPGCDWARLGSAFADALGEALGSPARSVESPVYEKDAAAAAALRFASRDWNERL